MNDSTIHSSSNKSGYIPGMCNIGKKEIERRKYSAIFSLLLCLLFVLITEWLNTAQAWRTLLFLPATSLGISFQQWRSKFCVAFGIKGVFNFGELGKTFSVEQQEYYRKDRKKAVRMIIWGILFGLTISIVYSLNFFMF